MKIYVVGLGPGGLDQMTPRAIDAIKSSDAVAGYDVYIKLIKEALEGKEIISTPMTREVERCTAALDKALEGKTVSMISSGDAGVYGMAGVMLQVAAGHPEVDIEVIPGITAVCSAGAVLGAPITHDFAAISLSDLLTPWELILKRLTLAAQGDFVICLYNPSSKKRKDYLKTACEVILKDRSGETACGYVRNIGREGEEQRICTLSELVSREVDMFTTVIIGNSATQIINGRLVTPRGYSGI
ncbi:precorrin-3B C(17)-methyltransferase [Clostridia bacterium]|nr:precorrin-3B C(17)-methyltransferase [Clostridia bacterium]